MLTSFSFFEKQFVKKLKTERRHMTSPSYSVDIATNHSYFFSQQGKSNVSIDPLTET